MRAAKLPCKKGQIMIEFTIIFGIALIVFAIMLVIITGQISNNLQKKHQSAVENQGQRLQNEMLAAYSAEDGYYTTFRFNPPYEGIMMSIYINNTLAIINSSRVSVRIKIPRVYGTIDTSNANITIQKNQTGSIIISS